MSIELRRRARVRGAFLFVVALLLCAIGLGVYAQSVQHPLDRVYSEVAGGAIETAPAGVVMRRLSLQLRGVIAGEKELADFEQTAEDDRQLRYAVAYLRDAQFAEYWGLWLGAVFRDQSGGWKLKHGAFYEYLARSLHENKGFDQLVREMLTASGSQAENPAVGFYLRDGADPLQVAEYVGRVFYAKRVQCARCHDHPYDSSFTQRDYYGLAAFFSQQYSTDIYYKEFERHTGRKWLHWNMRENLPEDYRRDLDEGWNRWNAEVWNPMSEAQRQELNRRSQLPLRSIVYYPELGLRFPRRDDAPGGDLVAPKFPDGSRATIPAGEDRRAAFARWLTAPENERFRKAMINRIWHRLMGWSFFEPHDDWNSQTVIRGEKILNHLDQVWLQRGYRIKDLVLYIVTSDAYARAMPPPGAADAADPVRYFQAQRLNPDQLMNSMIKGAAVIKVGDIWERRLIPIDADGAMWDIDLAGIGAIRKPSAQQRDFSSSVEVNRPAEHHTFLSVFGAGPRVDIDDDDATLTIEQILTMVNGRLSGRLAWEFAGNDSAVKQVYDRAQSMEAAYNWVFRNLLGRDMSAEERESILRLTRSRLSAGQSGYNREALQDLLWAIFNSQEFLHVN